MTGMVPLPSSLRGYHSIGWRIKKKQYLTSHYEIKSNTMSAFTVLSVAPFLILETEVLNMLSSQENLLVSGLL